MSKAHERLAAHCRALLAARETAGLRRFSPTVERQGKYLVTASRRLLDFTSNDYLGLAACPRWRTVVADAFARHGVSGSSSRAVGGSAPKIREAEHVLADFFGYEDALLFPSGWQANVGLMTALFRSGDTVYFDRSIHNSLARGLTLSGARLRGFRHSDFNALERRMGRDGFIAAFPEPCGTDSRQVPPERERTMPSDGGLPLPDAPLSGGRWALPTHGHAAARQGQASGLPAETPPLLSNGTSGPPAASPTAGDTSLHRGLFGGIVVETLYSMDGDRADMPRLADIAARSGFAVVTDEAHAFGVLGPEGRGLAQGAADTAVGTFGKAAGLFGAVVLCPATMRDWLIAACEPLLFTTSVPEALGAALINLPGRFKAAEKERDRLRELSAHLRQELREAGFSTGGTDHIISVPCGAPATADSYARRLRRQGIAVLAAMPPTVPPEGAMLRISLTALHDRDDIDRICRILTNL